MNHNIEPREIGHIEMQQELLKCMQLEISSRLFVSGVASRIIDAKKPHLGAKTNVEGVEQLDKLFLPSITCSRDRTGRTEKTLDLAVVTNDDEKKSRTFGYISLGAIDEQNFLYPHPGISSDDAWAVYYEAIALEKLKTGSETEPPTLPNLEPGLLGISNPYTGIRAMHQKD